MKKDTYILTLLLSLILFSACKKETEGISGVIHFELKGDETMLVPLNTSYTEPGYYVTYKNEDITKSVKIVGEVNPKKVGIYTRKYSFTNKDGIITTKTRTVIVADPNVKTDISGKYITVKGTNRLRNGSVVDYPGYNIVISKIAPGFFEISDFLGGYYDQKAKFGSAYACSGYVQLKEDNTLTLLSSSTLPWGDTLTGVDGGIFNPKDASVSWKAQYAKMTFTVVLNKVQ